METPSEATAETPAWIADTKAALERYRGLSGKMRKKKLPVTHRDVERELSWHDQARAAGQLTEEQYWKRVAETLHTYGVTDVYGGGVLGE